MFQKAIIILCLLLMSQFTKAQTGWVKQKFGDKLTIGFPAEVKKVNETTYIAKDSTGTVYGVVIVEMDKSNYLQASATDSLLAKLKFIDMVVGSIKTKMPKYAIGDVKISEINEVKTYSLAGLNEENKASVYINIFLVDDISYSLTCFVPANANPKNKAVFMQNFSIAK